MNDYQRNFPESDDPERNTRVNLIGSEIGPKLLGYFDGLRIEIATNR